MPKVNEFLFLALKLEIARDAAFLWDEMRFYYTIGRCIFRHLVGSLNTWVVNY